MKKYIILAFATIITTITFVGCKGYDEGPEFSMLTPEYRLKGIWDQTELYINDALQENSSLSFKFTFNSDKTGTRQTTFLGSSSTVSFEWKFNDDKTLLLTLDEGSDTWEEATILRLTNKECWIIEDAGVLGMWEFRFEKI
ncbi:MAG: hypothetical protein PHH30_07990 [Bacteroidales bacterium]|nr:hypothetical protein [Bacteroidales bacterium]MDD3860181.1 hypothetical protein [Bacteroidales bacterium]